MSETELNKICRDVEAEEYVGMGGLSTGLYADYAKDVAKRYAEIWAAQAAMREDDCRKMWQARAIKAEDRVNALEGAKLIGTGLEPDNLNAWGYRAIKAEARVKELEAIIEQLQFEIKYPGDSA